VTIYVGGDESGNIPGIPKRISEQEALAKILEHDQQIAGLQKERRAAQDRATECERQIEEIRKLRAPIADALKAWLGST